METSTLFIIGIIISLVIIIGGMSILLVIFKEHINRLEFKITKIRHNTIDDVLKLIENHEEEIYVGVFDDIEKLKQTNE